MLTEMCQCILKASQSTMQNTKAKSFQVSGISNKIGGSENDFLWHQSKEESCQEEVTEDGKIR
jgi:hypothetical protein